MARILLSYKQAIKKYGVEETNEAVDKELLNMINEKALQPRHEARGYPVMQALMRITGKRNSKGEKKS